MPDKILRRKTVIFRPEPRERKLRGNENAEKIIEALIKFPTIAQAKLRAQAAKKPTKRILLKVKKQTVGQQTVEGGE